MKNQKSEPEGVWVKDPDDPNYPNVVSSWTATCGGFCCNVVDYGETRLPRGFRWYVLLDGEANSPRIEGVCADQWDAREAAEHVADACAASALSLLELCDTAKRFNGQMVGGK